MFYAVVYKGFLGQAVICNLACGYKYESHTMTNNIAIAREAMEFLKENTAHLPDEYKPEYRVVEMVIKELT